MSQPTHEEIVQAFNNYLKEHETFEGKGVKLPRHEHVQH